MPAVWEKADPGLATIYANYLREAPGSSRRVHLALHFTADLAELEELGFTPDWQEDETRASGTVDLARLEELAEHRGVHRMVVGRRPKRMLDISVPQVRANLVWSLAGGVFSGSTGAQAIVGILDTGIDFRHPFFLQSTSPDVTRIKRIWDPGLVPTGAETSPAVGLLAGGSTYGVEYTDVHINRVLQGIAGAMPVRHRDCGAHGTHVASIAAGDGRPAFTSVGVAPRAEIVVVKVADFGTHPTVAGVRVGFDQLFKDAVTYVRNVAGAGVLNKPVAINYSFGSEIGPHDGLTEEEDWLFDTFAAGGSTGRIFVQAAGNSAGSRQHARIDFAAAGSVDIPIDLVDGRTNRREHDRCVWENATRTLYMDVYYPPGASTLSGALDIPADGRGFIAGPALGLAPVSGSFGGRAFNIYHSPENVTLRGGRGTAARNLFEVEIEPFRNRHRVGRYVLRLTASGPLTAHLWLFQAGGHGLLVARPPAVIPAEVHVVDEHLIGDNGGAGNTITVAAYNAETAARPIADFSSRGPLVSYGGAAPAAIAKPDITAPGVAVDAAKSRDIRPVHAGPTIGFGGTSMASPHVTGAVALMLSKNKLLTVAQVRAALAASVRPVVAPVVAPPAAEGGSGRIDVRAAVDATPP